RSGGGRAFLARPQVRRALDRLTSPSDSPGIRAWLEEIAVLTGASTLGGADDELDVFGDPTAGNSTAEPATVDDDLLELGALAAEYLRYDSGASAPGFVSWLEASLRSDPPRQA